MPKVTLLTITVTFGKANGKPSTRRDARRIDEALLNETVALMHGCSYAVNSTVAFAPVVVDGDVEVVFEVEVENYEDGEHTTSLSLLDAVEADIGCFAPEAYEVQTINVHLAR